MRRALLLCGLVALSLGSGRAEASADTSGVRISSGAGTASDVALTDLASLPVVQVSVSFDTAKGLVHARFAGPLLWAVLVRDGTVDPAKPRRQAAQTVLVTGRDGYAAALAIGEISPDFEGKQVILAESMNGQPLGLGHLRIVIPNDRRGARDVRDVVRITVSAAPVGPPR